MASSACHRRRKALSEVDLPERGRREGTPVCGAREGRKLRLESQQRPLKTMVDLTEAANACADEHLGSGGVTLPKACSATRRY